MLKLTLVEKIICINSCIIINHDDGENLKGYRPIMRKGFRIIIGGGDVPFEGIRNEQRAKF